MNPIFDVFHFSKPTTAQLKEIHESQRSEDITYTGVGLTLESLPDAYHHLRAERVIGSGADLFSRGQNAIRSWTAQAELGLVLEPSVPEFREGAVLVFALPMKPSGLWATGACRIMRVIDEPLRFGFIYGTLPHHPESGEEAFLVHHREDGTVSFTVTAFSRAKSLPMRAAGPIGRIIQRRAAEIYLNGYEKSATKP